MKKTHDPKKALILLLAMAFSTNLSGQAHDLTQGVVFHLSFDGNITDQSASAIPVVQLYSPTLVADRNANPLSALEFANLVQSLNLDSNDTQALQFGPSDFSIGFWLKKNSTTNNYYNSAGINKWHSNLQPSINEWALNIGGGDGPNSNKPSFRIQIGSNMFTAPASKTVDVGQWTHLMGIREGSDIKLYIDGVLESIVNVGTGAIDHSAPNPRDVLIGRYFLNGEHSNATFDDIVIYDRALTTDEIAQLMTYGVTNEDNVETPTSNQWLEDGNGNLYYDQGKVSVGVNYNNVDYSFAVKGEILTEGVRVDTYSNWPDYVFSSVYKVPSLSEVSTFIETNKHLPGLPSAQEVKSNGFELSNMDAMLLKKIEELTLYTISQEKRIKAQRQEIESLKKLLKERAAQSDN